MYARSDSVRQGLVEQDKARQGHAMQDKYELLMGKQGEVMYGVVQIGTAR